jgi:predicted metal-binding membrane protein
MGASPAAWYAAGTDFMGMWMAMMAPMMLPALLPMLVRYRRALPAGSPLARHGAAGLVVLGYFAVWALLGGAVHAVVAVLSALEPAGSGLRHAQPAWAGAAIVLAAGVQLSPWKARRLARCRDHSDCMPDPGALGAWRHGVILGVRCALSCGNLMLALLALGMRDPVAMAGVTLIVAAERLAPAPRPAAGRG